MKNQLERIFFDRELTIEDLDNFRKKVDPDNPESEFNKFVGNRKALKKLSVIAYNAMQRDNHLCNDISLCLIGPPSTGKTTLVKLFAKTLNLPLVEHSPRSIKTLDDFLEKTYYSLQEQGITLVDLGQKNYQLPSSVTFIDEVHALRGNIIQGLLKATEKNDGILLTESGYKLDCRKTCWIIATTDIGKVFDAFRSRFSTLELKYLTREEVSVVVKKNHPDLPADVCDLVAKYNPKVPRRALEFARYLILYRSMHKEVSWQDAAREVALNEGIDEYGMSEPSLSVLKTLSQHGSVALKRLQYVLGKKIEEIEKYILPELLMGTDDQPPLINITKSGLILTEDGKKELEKRNLIYVSDQIN